MGLEWLGASVLGGERARGQCSSKKKEQDEREEQQLKTAPRKGGLSLSFCCFLSRPHLQRKQQQHGRSGEKVEEANHFAEKGEKPRAAKSRERAFAFRE